MKNFALILLGLLLSYSVFPQENRVSFTEKPDWVSQSSIDTALELETEEDFLLLLNEIQVNVETDEHFSRFVYKINTVAGIRRLSSFYIAFDPKVYKLRFHEVNRYRNDTKYDILSKAHTDYEKVVKYVGGQVYTQEAKFRIHFEDLAVGDLIELVYTEKGKQPDLYDHFVFNNLLALESEYTRKKLRLVFNKDRKLSYFLDKGMPAPAIKETKTKIEWIWDVKGIEASTAGYKTPNWCDNGGKVHISSFSSFKEMQGHYQKHYAINEPPSKNIQQYVSNMTDTLKTLEDKVNKVFAFVQNDINYLAYGYSTPTNPDTVFKQQFGDCKSMTFLTTKMLKVLGVESYPFIVNSYGINLERASFKTPQNFNHCIVEFKMGEKYHYFDPTLSFQGGKATEKYLPHYRKGISLRSATDSMVSIPAPIRDSLMVRDVLKFDKYADEVELKRLVLMTDDWANVIRSWHETGGTDYTYSKLNKENKGWLYDEYSADTTLSKDYIDLKSKGENKIILKSEVQLSDIINKRYDSEESYLDLSYLHGSFKDFSADSTFAYYKIRFPYTTIHEVIILGLDPKKINQKEVEMSTNFLSFSRKAIEVDGGVKFIFHVQTFDDNFPNSEWKAYQKAYELMDKYCQIKILKE